MNEIKNLYADAKKLLKIDKRTRRSLLKNIDDLDFHEKMCVIIYFTEFERKTKEFKRFWYIVKEKYTIKDLFGAQCCTDIFLICPKMDVIKELSSTTKGLEIINSIYQKYDFLSQEDKLVLLEAFCRKNIRNVILERETGKICVEGEVKDALAVVENFYTDQILDSLNSSTILSYYNDGIDKLNSKDKALLRKLICSLFEEENVQFIDLFFKAQKLEVGELFGEKGRTLESLAVHAYFYGNSSTDPEIFRILSNCYDKSNSCLIEAKRRLKIFKYPKFTPENTRKYILENIWASEFLGNFLNLLTDFLPDNFLSILLNENVKYEHFFKLIDGVGFQNNHRLIYKEDFFEVALKSHRFRKYMMSEGYKYLNNEDLILFISK